ncbi:DUF4139 domain-containing protein [Ideonella sp. BN130291]|uniref:DUF4139 domain-containing protein n=1 Tax=Ideonella sp. BN130291 TaxID=3112940 RepID=UPI002E25597F|nr:DUF4139 domain-containing protein [Ideonella sp. BN130291]
MHRFRSLMFAAVALATSLPLLAAAPKVSRVTLYPGGATVERELRMEAGTQRFELGCLPATFAPESLRVESDADVRIGEIVTDTLDGPRAEPCRNTGLDSRIRPLEERRAELEAQRSANELVLGYLKQVAAPASEPARAGALPDARQLSATGDALRRGGQEAFARQLQITRQIAELDRTLAALHAERDRNGAVPTQWRSVRFAAQSPHAATVRVAYEVPQAGWTPSYRASLDSKSGAVLLERQAVIAQTTGEDWRGVRLKLSTGQPRRAPQGPLPTPWWVDVLAERSRRDEVPLVAPAAAPAAAMDMVAQRKAPSAPLFDVSVFQGSYATEFDLPGDTDLASDGQRVTVTLARTPLPARLIVRTTPQLDPHAYLVAQAKRPEGVWPRGPLQLRRDGAVVGSTDWAPASEAQFSLPFGTDELVQVEVEGQKQFTASAGVFGSRKEQQRAVAYVVRNRHRTPVQLQILEASPVAASDAIKVAARFTPAPSTQRWKEQPGVVAWELALGPDQSARFSAEYTLNSPKDAQISGLR